jgi:diaminopimelate epimerase
MLRFTKMHGAGNDFVCLDGVVEPDLERRDDLDRLARAVCDRRAGIGGDGLILISAPDETLELPAGDAVRMRMFNADGSESAMCGNGLRCVAKYAVEHGLVTGEGGRVLVQTGAGVMEAACRSAAGGVEPVTVNMGRPILDLAEVPVVSDRLDPGTQAAVFVSMGNPHAVFFVEDVGAVDLAAVGPRLERHAAFPQRMNVHFVEVAGPGEVAVRTWERGSGITGACGSGACAVCVAGVLTGRTARNILAHLPAGDLELVWEEDAGHVLMTGPAVEVFNGIWGG